MTKILVEVVSTSLNFKGGACGSEEIKQLKVVKNFSNLLIIHKDLIMIRVRP